MLTTAVLLPSLSPLLHDTAEKVRVAFVDLLTSVKTIRSIRFYDIVPVDQLLHRLAADKCVTKKLTSLLLNSYFPYNKETAVQVTTLLTVNSFTDQTLHCLSADKQACSHCLLQLRSKFRPCCSNLQIYRTITKVHQQSNFQRTRARKWYLTQVVAY